MIYSSSHILSIPLLLSVGKTPHHLCSKKCGRSHVSFCFKSSEINYVFSNYNLIHYLHGQVSSMLHSFIFPIYPVETSTAPHCLSFTYCSHVTEPSLIQSSLFSVTHFLVSIILVQITSQLHDGNVLHRFNVATLNFSRASLLNSISSSYP